MGNDTTSNTYTSLGLIQCEADGTHAAGDNPTRLVFSTTADGASSPTERMRIDSSGRIGIGEVPSTNSGLFNVKIDNSSFHLGYGTNYDNYYSTGASGTHIFRNAGTEQMRIDILGGCWWGRLPQVLSLELAQQNSRYLAVY